MTSFFPRFFLHNKEMSKSRQKLGIQVRLFRLTKGISQKELAQRSALPLEYIKLLETGSANPTLEELGVLAQALEISLAELFDFSRFSQGGINCTVSMETYLSECISYDE